MPNLKLYSRGDTKRYLAILFSQITHQEYNDARNTALQLKNGLLKYYITRGVDCTNIYDIFHEFDYLLRFCSGSTKQNTCFDFIKKIRGVSQLVVQNPIEQLRQIYEDLRHSYLHLSKENAENILDCFDEIRELQPRLQERGGSSFNYYTYMLKDMGACEGILVDVTTYQNDVPSAATIKGLTGTFQKLFASIQAVFAPPIRLDIKPKDIQRFLKGGTSLAELAKASGHREEDLQLMLNQIEEAEEEE